MTNLNGFYFDEYALSFLAQFILTGVMLFYSGRTITKTGQGWATVLFFIGMALYAGTELIITTAVWKREFYAFYLRYMMLYVGLLAGLQFYHFPKIPGNPFIPPKKELPIVAFVFIVVALGVIGWGIYQWSQLKPGGHPDNQAWLPEFGIAVIVGWYSLLLLRRLWGLRRSVKPYRLGWQHLPLNQQNPTRVLYAMSLAVLFALPMTVSIALTTVGLAPQWLRLIVPTAGVLIHLFLVSTAFFRNPLAGISFNGRVVGVTLIVVFLVLGLAGVFMARIYKPYIIPSRIPAQTVRFTPDQNTHYLVMTFPPQSDQDWGEAMSGETVPLPFPFVFGGQSWLQVNLSQGGVVAFGNWSEPLYAYNYLPAIVVYQGEEVGNDLYYLKSSGDKVTVTWPIMAPAGQVVQVVLYADGRFDLTYPSVIAPRLQRIGFQSGDNSTDFAPFDLNTNYHNTLVPAGGLLTDYKILSHQALHQLLIPLVLLVLLFSTLSIIGFPFLFNTTFVKPLRALVNGVRQVESGNLDVIVPPAQEDELGLVIRSFNQMVGTIRTMTQTMDSEIKSRIQELADSQRQLGALEERERIGREIHDDLGQVMGYVQMQVEAALARLQRAEHEQATTILSEVDQVAQEAHNRVRQYILGIRTGKQQELPVDFWTALDSYLTTAQERYGLKIELTVEPDLRSRLRLTPRVETQLLRIVQEGITNIYKHAQATTVQLAFTIDEQWLTLRLQDNGCGFVLDEESVNGDTHFGLKIMQERAESVNGLFQITSVAGQGSQLHLQIPYALASTLTKANQKTYPWRVLLVDDHSLFREGLGNMLKPYGVQIIGTAANGREAESLTATLQPDIVLMDIHMPEQDGLETTRRLKQQFPHIKIVVLTMAEEEQTLLQALQYGASGYLLKNLPAPEFLSLLTDVMAGKTIIAPRLAPQALMILSEPNAFVEVEVDEGTKGPLTVRQQDVLVYLGQGLTNKQIGQRLHISENTVKYHIKQMMERLHLQTRHELIRYHLENEE